MIFDHGIRVFDGVTKARFKAIMDGNPNCAVCHKNLAVGIWMNPRTQHIIPMCQDHLTEYYADDENAGGLAQ